MSRSRISLLASLLFFFFVCTSALEVAADSPCALKCIDDPRTGNVSDYYSSRTTILDLSCHDWQYDGSNSTSVGQKFKDCQNCLLKSGFSDPVSRETDRTWFMFNNRATLDWCLFERFDAESTENITSSSAAERCGKPCDPVRAAIDDRITANPSTYDFCEANGNITENSKSCLSCLYANEDLTILGNILTTVDHMCATRPAISYTQFPSDQEIYASKKISLGATSASPSSSPSASASPSTSAPPASETSKPPTFSFTTDNLSKGAIAGIVLGILVLVGLLLGACLYCLRRKRRSNQVIVEVPAHEQKPEYYQYNAAAPATATTYSSNQQQQQHEHDQYGAAGTELHEAPGSIAAVEAGERGHAVELPVSSKK